MKLRSTFAMLVVLPSLVPAQSFQDADAYQAWKSTLASTAAAAPAHRSGPAPSSVLPKGGGQPCDCWVQPDSSYFTIDNNLAWNATGFQNADDGSHGPIALPFPFDLFGTAVDTAYININGNVSFGTPYISFTSTGFPANTIKLVAPFWADVDLRGPGVGNNIVQFKVTPTAMYVNWTNVGYFNQMTDKVNSFQLIITDGIDPAVSFGNNVSFCYKDMQWTTGAASGGMGGFGGTAASVGVNLGDGVEYAQVGRYDAPGIAYDGPFLANDQVDWLDSTHFLLNIADTAGVPPIFASTYGCDTVAVQVGQTVQLQMLILAGGPGELVSATASCGTLNSFVQLNNPVADHIEVLAQIDAQAQDIGYHQVTYLGQNDDLIPLESTYKVVVEVVPGATALNERGPIAFSLAPNPAVDQLNILLPDEGAAQVDLMELDGRVIRSVAVTSKPLTLELSGLSVGTYMVRVSGAGGSSVQRFVRSTNP